LHVLPTFDVGGQQTRTVDIINHLGRAYRHSVLALDGAYGCRNRLSDRALVDFPSFDPDQPWLIPRLRAIRARLRAIRPHLLATYNWGAIEWALANGIRPLCRHVHLEDGFGPEESERQFRRRVAFRRAALMRTNRLVVPSLTLVEIARQSWKIPSEKILHIPNGIDCARFGAAADQRKAEASNAAGGGTVIGTIAPLRPEKNLDLLLRVFAEDVGRSDCRLLIVGDGPERGKLSDMAMTLGLGDKVVFAGQIDAVEQVLPSIDIFVMSSKTEQMPISLLQAMAAGRPVVATDVGDLKAMLAPENRAYVAPKDDGEAFARHLTRLLDDPALRADLGARNQDHVCAHYGLEPMLRAYERLFEEMTGPE
jgi:glycosyltransferase involved in cell wall biosynthesis